VDVTDDVERPVFSATIVPERLPLDRGFPYRWGTSNDANRAAWMYERIV
jgi:hypothetical protein